MSRCSEGDGYYGSCLFVCEQSLSDLLNKAGSSFEKLTASDTFGADISKHQLASEHAEAWSVYEAEKMERVWTSFQCSMLRLSL